jgi:ubiquinone/menaquinone biosynthesis C-methylase UbiE
LYLPAEASAQAGVRIGHMDTSWEKSAFWYDSFLEESKDSYQANVILPNILRALDIKKGRVILDLACGQGFFTRQFHEAGAKVIGVDISRKMIELAKKNSPKEIEYHVAPAHRLGFIKDGSIDVVTIILGIQNIENINDVFKEVSRVLRKNGRMFIAMNHPAFRVLKKSSWGFDVKNNIQYRRIDEYLSESKVKIEMHPSRVLRDSSRVGSRDVTESTVSFHRSLQVYFKILGKIGFGVTRLEEWISPKKSQVGPRQKAEDKARKEIPLFLFLEAVRVK